MIQHSKNCQCYTCTLTRAAKIKPIDEKVLVIECWTREQNGAISHKTKIF